MKLLIAEDEAIIRMDLKEPCKIWATKLSQRHAADAKRFKRHSPLHPIARLWMPIWMAMTDLRQLRKSHRHSYAPL